jgi:hypothetical protein
MVEDTVLTVKMWDNDNFTPGKNDFGFKEWARKGMVNVMDLYNEKGLMSFEELRGRFNIPQKHFFK